jgi:hypothetical protein
MVLDVLAARWRLGEHAWTFPAKLRPALRALEDRHLVWWKVGVEEGTCLAVLTEKGRALVLLESYSHAPVTEYGTLYSSGGYLTMNGHPAIEAVYPMADRIRDGMRFGGHVYRRRIVTVEDWEEITETPEEKP